MRSEPLAPWYTFGDFHPGKLMFHIYVGCGNRQAGIIECCREDTDLPRPTLLSNIGQGGSTLVAETTLDTGRAAKDRRLSFNNFEFFLFYANPGRKCSTSCLLAGPAMTMRGPIWCALEPVAYRLAKAAALKVLGHGRLPSCS